MNSPEDVFTRRRLLQGAAPLAAGTAFVSGWSPAWAEDERSEKADKATAAGINVKDFGAAGDGTTDDTSSIQAALKAASDNGGDIVLFPRGNYRLNGTLDVPQHVTLSGVFRAPTARTQNRGTTLLAYSGKGNAEGTPLITLRQNSTLHGLTIFYPDQVTTDPPHPYPWTVRGIGDNCSIVDVLLVNPYQAVDFGTHPCGRHYISGLYAQALYRGIFVDQCFDVGRISNVHLWPFWRDSAGLRDFVRANGTAFTFGRTDWEYVSNCFCIFYRTGFHFIETAAGTPNCDFTQSGSDLGPTAVKVQNCQGHAGLLFSNCQMMAGVEIESSNIGPVKFTGCGFWGWGATDSHALVRGSGHVTFNGCHFIHWGQVDPTAHAIRQSGGGLTVMGCDFMDNKPQVQVGSGAAAAIVIGNRVRGSLRIDTSAGANAEVGMNVSS